MRLDAHWINERGDRILVVEGERTFSIRETVAGFILFDCQNEPLRYGPCFKLESWAENNIPKQEAEIMGFEIIKQAEGVFAVWSTVVDEVVEKDLTREGVGDFFVDAAHSRNPHISDDKLDSIRSIWEEATEEATEWDIFFDSLVQVTLDDLRKSTKEIIEAKRFL